MHRNTFIAIHQPGGIVDSKLTDIVTIYQLSVISHQPSVAHKIPWSATMAEYCYHSTEVFQPALLVNPGLASQCMCSLGCNDLKARQAHKLRLVFER